MRQVEFLFLIEEIGVSLKLSQSAIALVLEYYLLLTNSSSNRFKPEIVIGACIFLVSKTREENKKIRDIINMCFVVTKLYRHGNQLRQQQQEEAIDANGQAATKSQQTTQGGDTGYVKLTFLTERETAEIEQDFAPTFNLQVYSQIKNEILQCEQHLLRLINYNLLTKKMSFQEIILNYIHIFKFDKPVGQFILNLANDTQYVDLNGLSEVEMAKGCIYLALDLIKDSTLLSNSDELQTHKIDSQFYDLEWWNSFMLISEKTLQCKEKEIGFTSREKDIYVFD